MANGFSTFASEHHYASGIILVTVGVFGAIGSITGELANMLAALFDPTILATSTGAQAGTSNPLGSTENAANNAASTILKYNPITGPVNWLGGQVDSFLGLPSSG